MASDRRMGEGGSCISQDQDDPLYLQSSDQPCMVLVTNPLTESNYIAWSRAMRVALGLKDKLGFIDGTCKMPDKSSPEFHKWKRVDCMVMCWILNSISKDLVAAFIFSSSARVLWTQLSEMYGYGMTSGPLLYQIKREISSLTQGNMPVVHYFTKLKDLWDELKHLRPIPDCNCGASKVMLEMESDTRLMQFLMGLNDYYDSVRSQILDMDPLPSINKAYSMVIQVEKQRQVQTTFLDLTGISVMLARNDRVNNKGKKSIVKCEYCKGEGHGKENCFKLHGYPGWWKGKKAGKGKMQGKTSANNMADTPLETIDYGENNWQTMLVNIIQQELDKFLKEMGQKDQINMSHLHDFAGPED